MRLSTGDMYIRLISDVLLECHKGEMQNLSRKIMVQKYRYIFRHCTPYQIKFDKGIPVRLLKIATRHAMDGWPSQITTQ